MTNEAYTQVLEVVGGQFRQHGVVDRVLAKCLLILTQTETVEPGRYVHARLPHAVSAARLHPISNCRVCETQEWLDAELLNPRLD